MLREQGNGITTADNFEDIRPYYEQLFSENNIQTLYKLRNWRERFHPEFLRDGEIYFTPPNELNDPFDITRPVKFDTSIIDSPEFFKRLVETAPEAIGVVPGRDAVIAARNKLEEIREDPVKYFLDRYMNMVNSQNYNEHFGVFSLTIKIYDEQLWGYYGGSQKGFAVGFDPMKLCEELFLKGELVKYTNEISYSKIINKEVREELEVLFKKFDKWRFETEFRFVRHFDKDQSKRKHFFSPQIVTEIILGVRTPESDKKEIIEIAKNRYPHARIYKLECDYANAKMYLEPIT